MHVAYLCCFQVIWSCWRANWKKLAGVRSHILDPEVEYIQHNTRPLGRVTLEPFLPITRPRGWVTTVQATRRHQSTTRSSNTLLYHMTTTRAFTRSPSLLNHCAALLLQPVIRDFWFYSDSAFDFVYHLFSLLFISLLLQYTCLFVIMSLSM